MVAIATIGYIGAFIGLAYAFFYIIRPTAGMSEEYKARKRRGDKIAYLYVFVGFTLIGSICMAILKAIY